MNRRSLIFIAKLTLCSALIPSQAFPGDLLSCSELDADGLFNNTKVKSAKTIAPKPEAGLPNYCEVQATIKPVRGSNVGVVYRFPSVWNGKLYAVGGGGFAGNMSVEAVSAALKKGYATASNDLGHESANSLDANFAVESPGKANEDAITDFGYRATNVTVKLAKQIIIEHYGKNPIKSYFEGCSTGGRQGLAEMQRYAEDFDGVIAGAPVYNALVYTNSVYRVQAFHAKPESNLMPEHVPLISKAVMEACDAKDGIKDGILSDPRQCKWDPAELLCKAGQSGAQCLSQSQVDTVRKVYDGLKGADGKWRAMPLMRGGEIDWVTRMIGTPEMPRGLNAVLGSPFVSHLVKNDPKYDIMSFDPDKGVEEIQKSFAGDRVLQENPDISRFTRRGGKLILWHGFNDPGPSPLSTIEYYEKVVEAIGSGADKAADAQKSARLFLAPGVGHCRGGVGPDQFDMLSALEAWSEKNEAPERIIATKAGSNLMRPLCPYPKLAKYKGDGDSNDPANFTCAVPDAN